MPPKETTITFSPLTLQRLDAIATLEGHSYTEILASLVKAHYEQIAPKLKTVGESNLTESNQQKKNLKRETDVYSIPEFDPPPPQ